jgi:hypothetical protein
MFDEGIKSKILSLRAGKGSSLRLTCWFATSITQEAAEVQKLLRFNCASVSSGGNWGDCEENVLKQGDLRCGTSVRGGAVRRHRWTVSCR